MKPLAALALILGLMMPSIHTKAIVPLDDPYEWRHELVWDSQTKLSTFLRFKESGDLNIDLKFGSWNQSYAEQMPILAVSCSFNVFNEFVFAKYGLGLNLLWASAAITGDTNGEFKYLLNNWILANDKVAVGATIRGDKLNLTKFGVLMNTYGINHKDDPEQWRDSILWNEKKPVSFSVRYTNGGELAGGLALGISNNQMPTAAIAVSTNINEIDDGNFWSNLAYSGQLNHDFLQAVIAGNNSDFKYLVAPKLVRADKVTGEESASVGAFLEGKKSQLTDVGATANVFGILIDSLANSDWDNVKEISLKLH